MVSFAKNKYKNAKKSKEKKKVWVYNAFTLIFFEAFMKNQTFVFCTLQRNLVVGWNRVVFERVYGMASVSLVCEKIDCFDVIYGLKRVSFSINIFLQGD